MQKRRFNLIDTFKGLTLNQWLILITCSFLFLGVNQCSESALHPRQKNEPHQRKNPNRDNNRTSLFLQRTG